MINFGTAEKLCARPAVYETTEEDKTQYAMGLICSSSLRISEVESICATRRSVSRKFGQVFWFRVLEMRADRIQIFELTT